MDEDMINNLNNILKNGTIPNDIKNIMSNISNNSSENQENSSPNIDPNMISSLLTSFKQSSETSNNNSSESTSSIDMATILKMKTIIDKMNKNKNDPRANLLRSLKPYLRSSRKDKLEQYVNLLSMTNVLEVFENNRW